MKLIDGMQKGIQMDKSSIEVKLNNHGRYTWSIDVKYETDFKEAVKQVKKIDELLKEEFPEHTKKAGGRAVDIDEYGS